MSVTPPKPLYIVGIPVFGPSQKAAQMEGSKAFSKDFMRRHNIPTAAYRVFKSSQFEEALTYAKTCGFKVVLKASGLAAGKGVLLPQTDAEIEAGLREIMLDQAFGSAGEIPGAFIDVLNVDDILQETKS
jgi:phosphoribosylamine--glycine ligase/phosphoribosylformylglycinamidine cyclo-ligase